MRWLGVMFCGLAAYEPPSYPLNICPTPDVNPYALGLAVGWWGAQGTIFSIGPDESGYCTPIIVNTKLPAESFDPVSDTALLGFTLSDEYGSVVFVWSGADAQTIAHELGHVAGFGHTKRAGQMMSHSGDDWGAYGLGASCDEPYPAQQ
jgi:hypothetical protein